MRATRSVGIALILFATIGLAGLVTFFLLASAAGQLVAVSVMLAVVLAGAVVAFLALRRLAHSAREEATRPAPAPVGEEEVRIIPKGPVSACLRCGSMGMVPAPMGADALFNQWRCPRCGWRGQPLQFDSGSEYAEFVRELRRGGGP